MQQSNYRIVLIEDNPADVMMITRALSLEASCDITVFSEGNEAYRFFENHRNQQDPPELVVLDLNLPIRDGSEILDLIRRHPELSATPVAVVSSSPKHVMKGITALADCYVTKPSDLDQYLAIGRELLACIKR